MGSIFEYHVREQNDFVSNIRIGYDWLWYNDVPRDAFFLLEVRNETKVYSWFLVGCDGN